MEENYLKDGMLTSEAPNDALHIYLQKVVDEFNLQQLGQCHNSCKC